VFVSQAIERLKKTLALINALDRSYRVHGSGVDAPGRGAFATLAQLS
jgi:hypothetical protein